MQTINQQTEKNPSSQINELLGQKHHINSCKTLFERSKGKIDYRRFFQRFQEVHQVVSCKTISVTMPLVLISELETLKL